MHGRDERGDRGDLVRRAERREDPHPSVAGSRVGGGDALDRSAIADLPDNLKAASLSSGAIILPLGPAVEAIAHFARAGRRIEAWEGWVKMRDGGRSKSLEHSGSFALPREPDRAADVARESMQRAQTRWERHPEYPGAALYFALTFAPVT